MGLIVPKLLAYTQSWNKTHLKIFEQNTTEIEQLGTGNVSSKILEIPILLFDKDEAKNKEVIGKAMDGYLKALRIKHNSNKNSEKSTER